MGLLGLKIVKNGLTFLDLNLTRPCGKLYNLGGGIVSSKTLIDLLI
jgi:hypothetical protein